MKYFIIDSENIDATEATFLYLPYQVEVGQIFEAENNHLLGTGKFIVKEVKIIDEFKAECICDKME